MFDFPDNTAPTQIIIPSLYHPVSPSFAVGADKENIRVQGWLSKEHLIQDDNVDRTIATVVNSYASSHSHHRRHRSYALSIGIGHPQPMKSPIQPARISRASRPPPLSIRVPNVAPLNPIRRRIFNTSRPSSPSPAISTSPACRSMPSLQAVSDWVVASQKRVRNSNSREQRSKLVATRILALNSPKPIRIRFPPSETPRPYVKSSLSQSFSWDS